MALAGSIGNIRRMSILHSGESNALLTGVDGIVRSDTIAVNAFSDQGAGGFKIRDKNYLKDKKKVPYAFMCNAQAECCAAFCSNSMCDTVRLDGAVL